VLAIPSQRRGIPATYGLARAQLDREAWAIEPSGRKHRGAAAISRVLAELGPPWSLVGRLYSLPLVRQPEDLVYRWFANHRSSFSWLAVAPECDQPDADCE